MNELYSYKSEVKSILRGLYHLRSIVIDLVTIDYDFKEPYEAGVSPESVAEALARSAKQYESASSNNHTGKILVELNEKEYGVLKKVLKEASKSTGSWEEFKEHICSIFDNGKTPSGLGTTNCYCDVDEAEQVIVINPTGHYYVVVMKYTEEEVEVSAMDYKLKNTVYVNSVDGTFREMCEESVALAKSYILKLDT